jgi:sensor domain CHASE-containing protein
MAKYWWILLIVAALAAVTAGTLASVNASKKEAEVLKETKERAGELQEAYNELASAYENLKSSIEDYTEAANALDKLAVGTTAWKDALLAANQQALELLDTYPELVNYISRNADGLLVLSEEGKD